MAASLLIAVLVPSIFLYMVWTFEIYTMSRPRYIALALVWGGFASLTAYFTNNFLLRGYVNYAQTVLLVAPVIEEVIKAAFLVFLAHRFILRYALDGTVYGFAVGTGFSILENVILLAVTPDASVSNIIVRTLSVSVMHSLNTALVGTTLGAFIHERRPRRIRYNTLTLLVTIVLHILFNLTVSLFSGLMVVLMGLLAGAISFIFIFLIVRYALDRERRLIANVLTPEFSKGEISAYTRPEDVLNLITQYHGELGPERTHLIQQYLVLQSRGGVLYSAIARNQRPEFVAPLQYERIALDNQLAQLRDKMGFYTQVWLRSVLPAAENNVWQHLETWTTTDNTLLKLVDKLNQKQDVISPQQLVDRKLFLRTVALFSTLDDGDLEDLCLLLNEMTVYLGDVVIQQGAYNERIYLVVSGTLIASTLDDRQNETIVISYSPGDTFGELGVLDTSHPEPAQVYALEDARLYTLEKLDLITLIYSKPQVALEMLQQMSAYIRRQIDIMRWMAQAQNPD